MERCHILVILMYWPWRVTVQSNIPNVRASFRRDVWQEERQFLDDSIEPLPMEAIERAKYIPSIGSSATDTSSSISSAFSPSSSLLDDVLSGVSMEHPPTHSESFMRESTFEFPPSHVMTYH